ncbi:MAG TPA: DEAD/DEAH box helicase [Polyangiaceae bacterium]|nr:DEAD/DEAH box helicase [Polyangiaceae bacterium]
MNEGASGFFRLHPNLQHAVVHDLGWRELRPVQDLTIDAVLDGTNAVVLAPTAGGKTEASVFPVLSRILSEEAQPVAALYLCPIRALLNNQEERIRAYARMVGLTAFKWHGDVSDSKKSRFRVEPAHILMTTPESLEVMLMSERTDARALFAELRTVVIDEVHAFAGDDRGAHLAALVERLVRIVGRDLQRIGLSATVGNPKVIGSWLQGSSERPTRVVDPPKGTAERELAIDYCNDVAQTATAIASVARGKKSLVFVESRSGAERVAHALGGSGVEVFIHHSSVSRAERERAEQQFAEGRNTAIVCTSTMELGIDVGDLDYVLQVNAPSTVASFLQRLGRTGRRPGTRSHMTFFCMAPDQLLQAAAICRLAHAGWVEDVRPAEHASHVLAHQILALSIQEHGLSRHRVLHWVRDAYPFNGITEPELHALVDTMVGRQILHESDGVLSLGARGETLYGRRHFFELYAVFSSAPMLRVLHGREEIGFIQALFIQSHDGREGPLAFRLGGRAWVARRIDWSKGSISVEPANAGQVPSWMGLPGALSFAICQAMKETLLATDTPGVHLSIAAKLELEALRASYQELFADGDAPLEHDDEGVQWHTFAGGAINRLLAAGLEQTTRKKWVAGNLTVKSKDASVNEALDAQHRLGDLPWEHVAFERARAMVRGLLTKFQPCLPEEAEDRLLAERLLDLPGTLRFIAHHRAVAIRAARAATRVADARVDVLDGVTLQPLPLPGVPYELKNSIRYVVQGDALRAGVRDILASTTVGLDVETALDFTSVCLVQIATETTTWLFDVLVLGDVRALGDVLENPAIAKLIHNARFERRALAKLGFDLQNVVDTLELSREARGRHALGGHGLAVVSERELGVSLDKTAQTSNWARRPLTEEQMRYAAADAEILLRIHEQLRSKAELPDTLLK